MAGSTSITPDGVVLAVCPHWGVHGEPDVLGLAAFEQRLTAVLSRYGGRVLAGDGELLLASLPTPEQAVLAAFEVHGLCAHGVVGLGYGPQLHTERGPASQEASFARRLAWRELPGQVVCTARFYSEVDLPPGLGAYRAPADREGALGFASYRLADYR